MHHEKAIETPVARKSGTKNNAGLLVSIQSDEKSYSFGINQYDFTSIFMLQTLYHH